MIVLILFVCRMFHSYAEFSLSPLNFKPESIIGMDHRAYDICFIAFGELRIYAVVNVRYSQIM